MVKYLALVCSLVAISWGSLAAAVSLPPMFSDHMVLQRDLSVPVWGWGNAGDQVSVRFADQEVTGSVDADGRWQVVLAPLAASSESQALTITVGAETTEIQDVVVGEVWVCSGQSNMEWTLDRLLKKVRAPTDKPIVEVIKNHLEHDSDPLIRQMESPQRTSHFEEQSRFDSAWITAGTADQRKKFTGVGYFFAKELRAELDVPVGLLLCAWGGRPIQPFIPKSQYLKDEALADYYDTSMASLKQKIEGYDAEAENKRYKQAVEEWEQQVAEAKKAGQKKPRKPRKPKDPMKDSWQPTTLYNAMINPLIPYGIRGAIWYQGETNAERLKGDDITYGHYLSTLITGWRDRWGQGDFSFYYCQLANYKEPVTDPIDEDSWVQVCNDMRLTLSLSNVGMAVLNDLGVENDIHPRNKIDVGKRLALWALAKDYGKAVVFSGPLYLSHSIQGAEVRIEFDHVGDGLMVGAKQGLDPTVAIDASLSGFQICGADRKWKWADARIDGTDAVVVSHPDISAPVEVRYAWAQNPTNANLYNSAGLPTSLFATK